MSEVYFFLMKTADAGNALQTLCFFIEKLYSEKRDVFIRTESDEQTKLVDDLLWTFRDESFVPHEVFVENKPTTAPVTLGDLTTALLPSHRDVLVNLTRETQPFYLEYASIVEIVLDETAEKNRQRETYKWYQTQQAVMKTLRS